jgi:hypothetical protein
VCCYYYSHALSYRYIILYRIVRIFIYKYRYYYPFVDLFLQYRARRITEKVWGCARVYLVNMYATCENENRTRSLVSHIFRLNHRRVPAAVRIFFLFMYSDIKSNICLSLFRYMFTVYRSVYSNDLRFFSVTRYQKHLSDIKFIIIIIIMFYWAISWK